MARSEQTSSHHLWAIFKGKDSSAAVVIRRQSEPARLLWDGSVVGGDAV